MICLVLSFAYCAGSVIIDHLDKSEVKATNFVWIVSIIALVVIYLKDMPALIVYILVTISGFAGALLLNELVCHIPFLRWCILGIKRYNRE